MKISEITVHHFRKITHLHLKFSAHRFHLILGDNGQGKTSLLEAIHLAASGKSFHSSTLSDLIQFDQNLTNIRLDLSKDVAPASLTLNLAFTPDKKVYSINHQEIKPFSKGAGTFHTVLFRNSDESLFTGSPEKRRQALDMFLSLSDPSYMKTLIRYKHIIRHRNHLLKNRQGSVHEFAYWNEALVEYSTQIIRKRLKGLAYLREQQSLYLAGLNVPFKEFRFDYLLSSKTMLHDDHQLKDKLAASLRSVLSLEKERLYSMTGAHTDDFIVSKDGHNIKKFASQGQIKAIMCAFRLAENQYYLTQGNGETPILLIDDCLRDLSPDKQHAFWTIIQSLDQDVFFAGTHRPDFFNDQSPNYVHYHMENGQIKMRHDSLAV